MRKSQRPRARSLFGAHFGHISNSYNRILLSVLALTLAAAAVWWGCEDDAPVAPQRSIAYVAGPGLLLGPIEGLTTAWHVAPEKFAVPRGSTVQLRCQVPSTAQVRWTGATEISRNDEGSTAECPTAEFGIHQVGVEVVLSQEDPSKEKEPRKPRETEARPLIYECEFEVVRAAASSIRVGTPSITRAPLRISETASNWELLKHYTSGSIAEVHEIGAGRYATAVQTPVTLSARVGPGIFGALTEWRVDGEAVLLGEYVHYTFLHHGKHVVEVGPPGMTTSLEVEAYEVTLEPATPTSSDIVDGVAATFTAHTEPKGFERYVTWLGAARFGTVAPATGTGEKFTVTFDKTISREASGNLARWVGVRADHATIAVDAFLSGTVEVAVLDGDDNPYPGVLVRLEGYGFEDITDGGGIASFNNVPIGSVPVTIAKTFTVENPGGSPIIINAVFSNAILLTVSNGLTAHLDCTFTGGPPPVKPGCGTVPEAYIVFLEYGNDFKVLMRADKDGPCPCTATMLGPQVPANPACPGDFEKTYNPKPVAQWWEVETSTCLGGPGCPLPIAVALDEKFK